MKLNTVEKINKILSAEIPSNDDDLQVIVLKSMIHVCKNWCQVNGKCPKRFAINFQNEGSFNENGVPLYKRTNTGHTFTSANNLTADNRSVVPYNGDVLKAFDCHINVVVCSSFLSVKYSFKYVYKGHDRAAVCS